MRVNDTEPIYAKYRDHTAPDTTACIFWLKNRRKADWRDRQEFTGADCKDLIPEANDEQRANALAALLAKTAAGTEPK